MAQYIHDTQVYDQERLLPLSMQKKYQKELSLLKKLRSRKSVTSNETVDKEDGECGELNENEEDDISMLYIDTTRTF